MFFFNSFCLLLRYLLCSTALIYYTHINTFTSHTYKSAFTHTYILYKLQVIQTISDYIIRRQDISISYNAQLIIFYIRMHTYTSVYELHKIKVISIRIQYKLTAHGFVFMFNCSFIVTTLQVTDLVNHLHFYLYPHTFILIPHNISSC